MGCCCLDHRSPILYHTAARIDPSNGDKILFYDALHPVIGDEVYSHTPQPSSAWVANGLLFNAVRFSSEIGDPRGILEWVVLTCWSIDSNSVLWWSHVDSSCTGLKVFADDNYVWVGTDDGEGFCFAASDGDLISEETGLFGYQYLTSGDTAGTCQFGTIAEYDHEFTNTYDPSLLQGAIDSWEIDGSHYITWAGTIDVYKTNKNDLASRTKFTTPAYPADTIEGATDSLYFASEAFTSYFKAYNYAGTAVWDNSTSEAKNFISNGDGSVLFTNTSNRLRNIDPSDGSTNWSSALIVGAVMGEPRRSVYDPVNDQFIIVAAGAIRPHSESTGSVNWILSGVVAQEFQLYGDDLFTCGGRGAIPA